MAVLLDVAADTAERLGDGHRHGHDPEPVAVRGVDLVELRLEGFAQLAPRGPELNERRPAARDVEELDLVLVEILDRGGRGGGSDRGSDLPLAGLGREG